MSCVVSSIEVGEDSTRPVILNFENGTIEPEQKDNLLCRYYKNKNNELQIGAATKNMLYSGPVESKGLYNTFIGICNKKKTKIRLVAVDFAMLSPKFETNELNASLLKLDSSNAELNKNFGSKQAKRKTEQREKMKMDIEAVKEQLEQTVAEVVVDAKDTVVQKIDEIDTDYKPRINRQAANVLDVYNINDLVSTEVLASTSEEVQRILDENDSAVATSPFVSQQIKQTINTNDSSKMFQLQLLLYIDCLIKFMHKQAKELSVKSLQLCPYSKAVQDDILKRYTIVSGKSRCRPNSMRDKCLCTILVLGMSACHNKLNLEIIAKELKLGLKRVQEVSRVLAFHVNHEMATLSLPLPPPVNMFNSKRKRK